MKTVTHTSGHARASITGVLLLVSVAATGAGDVTTRERVGQAFDLDGPSLVYTEVHRETVRDGEVVEDRVTYLGPDRRTIAEKIVDFRTSALAPRFRLKDLRTGHVEGFSGPGSTASAEFRRNRDAPLQRAGVPGGDDLVVDAGFDRFIEQHWDELVGGRALVRRFLIPSRLEALDFRIRHTGAGASGDEAFVLEIDSALLRLLVPSIRVSYDAGTRRLVSYAGISNIRDAVGDNLEVRIEFAPTRFVMR